ncbi:unnamed protein product [Cochlearia groenlandica]
MAPFMYGSRAFFSLLSRRSRSGIAKGRFRSRGFGSLTSLERLSSSYRLLSNVEARRVSSLSSSVVQTRRFLGGLRDGKEDEEEVEDELSNIYEERHVLGYTPEQVFDVVADVDMYNGFFPWCQRSEVVKKHPDGSFDAEMEFGFKFLVEKYTSHVEVEKPECIKSTVRDAGVFDHLINLWRFKPGPVIGTCDLYFHVDFKFRSPLYRQVGSIFLKENATRVVSAFSDRCRVVYGPGVQVDEQRP